MNICGKLGAIPLLDPPNDEVLEIGTLHGMFSAGLIRMLERDGSSPSLTIVDPFAGVQLQPGTEQRPDPTGTPVDEHAVRTNPAPAGRAGVAAGIQQGFSEDPETRAAVTDRSEACRSAAWTSRRTSRGGQRSPGATRASGLRGRRCPPARCSTR
ncbi:hypothetical protein ACIQMV_24350 [Streptomyces sp. NPDC091412]|uniref:hypothetical protein n=1 Tax=Streptomyces sp. NPDC091412 TaxID=3366002 RepID=UPI0038090D7C